MSPGSKRLGRKRRKDSSTGDSPGLSFRLGETGALQEVRRRVQRILAFRGYRIPREDRRDLEQVVMTQLWQAARDPRTDLTIGFWAFVETVTARRAIDWLRVHREHAALDPRTADRSNPLADTLAKERTELLQMAVANLPEECRRLIELHLGEGKSYREISQLLPRSEGALRVQMYRCLRRARELLAGLGAANPSEPFSRGDRE